jgi:serine/threonine protein kinase
MASQLPSSQSLPPQYQQQQQRQQDWKEKGAARLVKTEKDENGNVISTHIIKRGVEDFEFGKTLGIGSYSTVVGATDKQTQQTYAIKILDKRHIIKEKKVKYVEIEKNTLSRLRDHPGIVSLHYTFQDESSLYFVLDYAANGELLSLIKKMGSLDEACTQYYSAQILDALEFMHFRGVIHRDLKPENILLDEKMRVKITDFGTACLLSNELDSQGNKLPTYPQNYRTNSFVGTAEYVSPELLSDKVQGKECDVWAFGCILYQLIAGMPPFKAANEYLTFKKIVKLDYRFPPGFPSRLKDLVRRILVFDPRQRYDIPRIKAHLFYEGFDWNRKNLWKQKHPRIMPYRPSSSSTLPSVSRSASNPIGQAGPYANSSSNLVQPNSSSAGGRTVPNNPRSSSTGNILTSNPNYYNPMNNSKNAAMAAVKQQQQQTHSTQQTQQNLQNVQYPPQPRPINSQLREQQHFQPPLSQHQQSPPKHYPQLQQPAVLLQQQQQQQQHQSKPPGIKNASPNLNDTNRSSFSEPVKPLELPPVSSVDAEYSWLLQSSSERILRVGHVSVMSASVPGSGGSGSSDDHGIISKLFTNRKRKRVLLVTTKGRLLVVSAHDTRGAAKLEIQLANPTTVVKEMTKPGFFTVMANNKAFTFEDLNSNSSNGGSSAWIGAFNRAKQYVENAREVASARSQSAVSAAVIAARKSTDGSRRTRA